MPNMTILPTRSKTQPIRSVQALRGFAACLVVIVHSETYWRDHAPNAMHTNVWVNGNSGVDLFFVISGLVMTLSTGSAKGLRPAAEFMKRRILRIAPLFWLATLVELAIRLRNPEGRAGTPVGWVASSMLFLRYDHRDPVLTVGWTLGFEMLFYLLFASAILTGWKPLHFLTPVMLAAVIAGRFRQPDWAAGSALLDPLLLEFLAGMALAYIVRAEVRVSFVLSVVLGFAGLAGLMLPVTKNGEVWRLLTWGAPAVLLVFSAVMVESRLGNRIPSWALAIGDASYSLYLFHEAILRVCSRTLLRWPINEQTNVIACLIVSVLGSLCLYRWVEKPLTIKLAHWFGARVPASVLGTERG